MHVTDDQLSGDPSARFVLPDDAPLLANLAALWAVDPKLAAAIEAVEHSPSYLVTPSKSGEPTLAMTTSDGRQIQLHSRYRPIDEAKTWVDPLPLEERAAFYVQGFGLGYHVEQLFDRAGEESLICVFEPDLVLLRTAFEQRDFTKLIESGRVLFFHHEDKAELFSRLMPHTAMLAMGFEPLVHAPSLQLQPSFHEQFKVWIDEFLAYAKTTLTTLVINGRRTAENIAHNLPWYVATPSLSRLKDHYAGKPAIIVSAGPSLRKNKHLLKDAAGKSVIIAVQTTLQPLLELGVEPQFVTSLDYHDICTRFFEKLPSTLKTELIAEPKAANAIFDLNPGPLSLLGNDFADGLIAEMKPDKARLTSGATVAHLAFYLAEHLGCDPIIFVGQDLGFSDGLCYAPGTSYEDVWRPELGRFCTVEMKQWEQIVRDRHILRRIPDYQGRPIYTEERLFTYLQHFEKDFAKTKARVIDATEGGVLKRGATVMKLAEAIRDFCRETVDPAPPAHPGADWSRLGECLTSLRRRLEEAQSIEHVSRQTLPLLEQIRDQLDDQGAVNRLISQIDVLRARIAELQGCYGLIMALSQQSELKKFQADRKIASAKLDGTTRQRRQVERDIDNVRSVSDAAQAFQKLVRDVICRIESMPQYRGSRRDEAHKEAA
jgi:hypothetical protein